MNFSSFACKIIDETIRKPIVRFEQIFDHLCIDESQDLAGYDLELVDRLLDSNLDVILIGDHRQATYPTNNSSKNSGYRGHEIVNKQEEWQKAGEVIFEYQNESRRCVQAISDFANTFFPDFPPTTSLNTIDHGRRACVGVS